jgi:hypothetical protein
MIFSQRTMKHFPLLMLTLSLGCAPSIEKDQSGCYLINGGHQCDCALTTDACSEVLGIWTDRCECAAEAVCDSSDPVTHAENEEGTTTTINASCEENWVYLNLSDKAQVSPETPADSDEWDLGFQRFQIKSNGGISGAGNVLVAMVSDTAFEDLIEAPASGYLSDAADSDDEDEDPDYPFLAPNAWYEYDDDTHILTPINHIYVVQSLSGTYYKIQFIDYYDDAGTSGYPKFIWGTVLAPAQ